MLAGAGLDEALDGVDVAYYLIHSMERASNGSFAAREEEGAQRFAEAAARAGVGGSSTSAASCPPGARSRRTWPAALKVEELLLEAVPDSVALRASIVIGARSRSFRFLVRLVERVPVIPMPPWARSARSRSTAATCSSSSSAAATEHGAAGGSFDIAGPDVVTYGELIERIRDALMIGRPRLACRSRVTPVAEPRRRRDRRRGPRAHRAADGQPGQRHPAARLTARRRFGVRLHRFDRASSGAARVGGAEPGSVAAR